MPSYRTQQSVGNVPERYRAGVAALVKLSNASFDELISALQRAPTFSNAKELSAWVAPESKSIPETDIGRIIEALTSLYRVRLYLSLSAERAAKDVVGAIREANDPSLQITEDSTTITERLSKMLAADSLNVIETKARELKDEYQHSFCDVRLFTDVRPVFGSNVADAPEAMLLVYMLKLGYHDSHEGRHREFYMSLDADDLGRLKKAIERAETKAKSIQSRLEAAGIKTI